MYKFNHQNGTTLSIDGAEIYCEETGEKNAPVLLFLHGGFGTIEDFNVILPLLENKFRIIGIDSRGQGKSTLGSGELSYERMQKDVGQVLKTFGVETLNIVGFSDGGVIGYRLAAFSKFNIEKLITIGSRWHPRNVESTKEILSRVSGEVWRKKFPETYETYLRLNPEPNFDLLADLLVKTWLNPDSYPNEKLSNYRGELLISRGDEDHLVTREMVFELAAIVKDSRLLNVPFAGHAAFVEQPEIFTRIVNQFLR